MKICLVILEHNIDSLDKFCIFCRDIEILCNARNLDIYVINILYIILIHIVHRKNPQNSKTIHSSKNSHFYKFYEKVKFLETGRALDLIFLSFIWSGISSSSRKRMLIIFSLNIRLLINIYAKLEGTVLWKMKI